LLDGLQPGQRPKKMKIPADGQDFF
jgi:hypothetical protein